MSLRITQSVIYDNYVGQMQNSLGNYMQTAEQGSTQKKLNTPSDDPAGMYKVLTLRNRTTKNTQLLSNCDTAKGWLKLEDSVLATQVPTVITSIKELAEQASTGTYTAEQRRDLAFQVREQFGSLLNMANTEFDGKSLFAGHKYSSPAFEQGLGLMSKDETLDQLVKAGDSEVFGNATETIAFQFTESGDLNDTNGLSFRWTDDGGESWTSGTTSLDPTDANYTLLQFSGTGAYVRLKNTYTDASGATQNYVMTSCADPTSQTLNGDDHTSFLRPCAYYQGDTNDEIQVSCLGTFDDTGVNAVDESGTSAEGPLSGNNLIRFGEQSGTVFDWSYSTDNGLSWVEAKGNIDPASTEVRLPLPEGYVTVALTTQGTMPPSGSQLLVHPEDASVDYEIMEGTYISVNGVGKDIFGGRYAGKPALQKFDATGRDLNEGRNLFEVVGDLVAYLETNNQSGCQESLAKLAKAEEYILTQATRVGGLENRVDVAYDVLTSAKQDINERLSFVEDIDLTELLVKMQRQQITYQTVLQSASMVMNLSLANYL
ncbi:MAG: flagellar hook-associated protein FlgL [Desulfovibrio sp.]|nr:flagellar hook-associated protein FlgL [Desulfovibrio sp.]